MTTSTPSHPLVRILIVDDHPIFREGLKMLLTQDKTLAVVGEAANAAEALALATSLQPEIVLLDVDLAGFNALQIVESLQTTVPTGAIIVMTGKQEGELQAQALKLGAKGYVSKEHTIEFILRAIRKVREGELWFDRSTVSTAVTRLLHDAPDRGKGMNAVRLTERESEIARLVGEGLKNDAIADRLSISEKTVRNNLTVIYEKIGVSDRVGLAIYAYRLGLAKIPH